MKILILLDVFLTHCRTLTHIAQSHYFLKKSKKSIYLQQTYGFGYYKIKSVIYNK